jgi:ParB family chromosome partitioning protein
MAGIERNISMSVTTASTIERLDVDPKTLLVDLNIRLNLNLNKEFVSSIRDLGVLVPIGAVRTASGELRVRYGHRRTFGAIEAGRESVPVEVIGDEQSDDAAQIERIVTQHAENAHRAGLDAKDEVHVVEQLAAFGLSASQIQRRTRMKRREVDAAMSVSGSELARAAAHRYDFLTLEQAAVVADFDSDDEAVKALVAAAKVGGFDHVAQRLRDERTERQARAIVIGELELAGVRVLERPQWSDAAKRLETLRDNGEPIDFDAHATCPGHAAFVEERWTADESSEFVTAYVCTDPTTYGHADRSTPAKREAEPQSEESAEAARAERRQVLANNKAWRSAETVRREWLRQFVKRKTAPKGTIAFLASELISGSWELSKALDGGNSAALYALGLNDDLNGRRISGDDRATLLGTATDARATVVALAVVLAAHEAQTGVHTWRNQSPGSVRYLQALVNWGYQLSDIESIAIGAGEEA